jgi:hypothetical protein
MIFLKFMSGDKLSVAHLLLRIALSVLVVETAYMVLF